MDSLGFSWLGGEKFVEGKIVATRFGFCGIIEKECCNDTERGFGVLRGEDLLWRKVSSLLTLQSFFAGLIFLLDILFVSLTAEQEIPTFTVYRLEQGDWLLAV